MGLASALAAQAGVGSAQQHTTSMQSWNPPPATMPTPVPAPGYMGPPAAAAPVSPSVIATRLQQIVSTNSLSTFYSQEKLHSLAAQVAQRVDFNQLAARWVRFQTRLNSWLGCMHTACKWLKYPSCTMCSLPQALSQGSLPGSKC